MALGKSINGENLDAHVPAALWGGALPGLHLLVGFSPAHPPVLPLAGSSVLESAQRAVSQGTCSQPVFRLLFQHISLRGFSLPAPTPSGPLS